MPHIKNIVKPDCKIIKIPHYTFMGYFLLFDCKETIDIAKGKYEVPTTWKKIKNTLKRHLQWRRK